MGGFQLKAGEFGANAEGAKYLLRIQKLLGRVNTVPILSDYTQEREGDRDGRRREEEQPMLSLFLSLLD